MLSLKVSPKPRTSMSLGSTGGARLLAWAAAGTAVLSRLIDGDGQSRFEASAGPHGAAIAPLGRYVATAAVDGIAWLWDAVHGTATSLPLQHEDWVLCVAFQPSGLAVTSAVNDGLVKFSTVPDGRPLCPPLVHPSHIFAMAWGGRRADLGHGLQRRGGAGVTIAAWPPGVASLASSHGCPGLGRRAGDVVDAMANGTTVSSVYQA